MISVGTRMDGLFTATAQGIEVIYDPETEQQALSFKLAVHVGIPQLLQCLLEVQHDPATLPHGVAVAKLGAVAVNFGMGTGVVDSANGYNSIGALGRAAMAPAVGVSQSNEAGGDLGGMGGGTGGGSGSLSEALLQANVPGHPVSACGGPFTHPRGCGQGLAPVTVPSVGQTAMPPPQPCQQPPLPHLIHGQQQFQQQVQPYNRSQTQVSTGCAAAPIPLQLPAANVGSPLNAALVEALREGNLMEARAAILQHAEVNCVESGPNQRTPLHHVLEMGGKVDAVNLLLQARANLNAVMSGGRTPLHVAIEQYLRLPPVVIRMLLCAQADLSAQDAGGLTPLDNVKMIAVQSCQSPELDTGTRVRQLLNEITEQPTLVIGVIDCNELRCAYFADMQNDKVVFHTESGVGFYSLAAKRVVSMKKLRRQQVVSSVKHISVNPELGTVVVCLEILDVQQGVVESAQNVSIVWPNGQFQNEEPLKLSIHVDLDGQQGNELPACVLLSRTQGPQMLLSRLCDGQVYCWRLNAARSQLVSEAQLTTKAGLVATSDNGCWIAVVSHGEDDGRSQGQVQVWTYETSGALQQNPKQVFTKTASPLGLTIQQGRDNNTSCFLAVVENASADGTLPPISISTVGVDGSCALVYRVRLLYACQTLSFCHDSVTHLLSANEDGSIVLYNLPEGGISLCHDTPGRGCVNISPDRSMIASTEANYFRVFRAGVPDASV